MRIVDSDPNHLTVSQAAALAGCSPKTVRRAVHQGMLLQRYVLGPHRPYLVFLRDEIERWRSWTGPRPDRPAKRPEQPEPHRRTAPQSPEMSPMLNTLSTALHEQTAQIRESWEALRQLTNTLAAIEQEVLVLASDLMRDVAAVSRRSKSQDREHAG